MASPVYNSFARGGNSTLRGWRVPYAASAPRRCRFMITNVTFGERLQIGTGNAEHFASFWQEPRPKTEIPLVFQM
jgi:hypothetical protein